jgi:tellurite resistance protein
MLDLKSLWQESTHRNFAESLTPTQAAGLRDLMLIAGLADDMLTAQERAEIAGALAELPGLSGTLDFQTADLIDHIDELYARHEEDSQAVLDDIARDLGDDDTRERAFGLALHLMKSDGFLRSEETFARSVASAFGLQTEIVDEMIDQVRSAD